MDDGVYGILESCHPPITIPAWAVMMTGKSPGELGLYGFRHRKPGSYTDIYIASSHSIKVPAVWDILAKHGKKSCLVSIPPSYPPKPINGYLISCFITPGADKEYTYPSSLKQEIESLAGKYIFDVEFRTEARKKLLEELYKMTEQHFKVIKYLMTRYKWDFFAFVEIGVDRVQHAFWKYFDPEHHLYTPGNEFEHVIEDYYKYIDEKVGELLKLIDEDTAVMVVSDHGAKRMKGAFCINEWLAQEGYLHYKEKPKQVMDLEKAPVDWSKTIAWGWGGYYARIYLNVKGREPQGVIEKEEYENVRDELAEKIRNIKGPNGEILKNHVYKPEELYTTLNGDPPDLIVYFDDLYWRSAGTVGHNTLYLPENDKGPDDAVHSMHGTIILQNMNQINSSKTSLLIRIEEVAKLIINELCN